MNTFIEIFGYPISYIEFFGVLTYFISVYFAIKVNVLTWSTSIISEVLFFIIYFESHTYANALLQIILLIICIDGWRKWGKVNNIKVSKLTPKKRIHWALISILSIVFFGSIIKMLPISDPYPYLDMSVFVLSILGVYLLAIKKIETWFVWISVNLIVLFIYSSLGLYFIAIQCVILIVMNLFALKNWNKNLKIN